MAFPLTTILDDFTRADSSPLDGDWEALTDSSVVMPDLVNGHIESGTPDDLDIALWNGSAIGDDCGAFATVLIVPSGDPFGAYVFARMSYNVGLSQWEGYGAWLTQVDGLGVVRLVTITADNSLSVIGVISTFTLTVPLANGDGFGFEIVGTTLYALYKPVAGGIQILGSVTDATYTTGQIGAGVHGIGITDELDDAQVSIDNFSGATLTEPPAAPDAPTDLTATAASSHTINLAWIDNATNETGFQVERSLTGTGGWSLIGTAAAEATSYASTGLDALTQYFYRVRAVNGIGESAYSNTADDTTLAITPPTALTATGTSTQVVDLAWSDNSADETGFVIERGTDGIVFASIGTVAADVETYRDSTVLADTLYYYRVAAFTATSQSAYSNIASVTVAAYDDWMITAAANALIDILIAKTSLSSINLFVRGGMPIPPLQSKYPFVEVLISEETPVDELTGGVSKRTYVGLITVTGLFQQTSEADWIDPYNSEPRRAAVTSYDVIKHLVMLIQVELEKESHHSLSNLTTTVTLSDQTIVEVVTAFRLEGAIVYGLDDRQNNYENFGSIPFVVETQRTVD